MSAAARSTFLRKFDLLSKSASTIFLWLKSVGSIDGESWTTEPELNPMSYHAAFTQDRS